MSAFGTGEAHGCDHLLGPNPVSDRLSSLQPGPISCPCGIQHRSGVYRLCCCRRRWSTARGKLIGGVENHVLFYADFAIYLSHWVDAAALMNKGIAAVCQVRDTGCVRSLENLAARRAPARRVEVELTPCCLRLSGGPIFVIAIMPPR
jgi:hypothetical protein